MSKPTEAQKVQTAKNSFVSSVDTAVRKGFEAQGANITCIYTLLALHAISPIKPCKVADYGQKGFRAWVKTTLCSVMGIDFADAGTAKQTVLINTAKVFHYTIRQGGITKTFAPLDNGKFEPNLRGEAIVLRSAMPEAFKNKQQTKEQAISVSKLIAASETLYKKPADRKSPLQKIAEDMQKVLTAYDGKPVSAGDRVALREMSETSVDLINALLGIDGETTLSNMGHAIDEALTQIEKDKGDDKNAKTLKAVNG